MAPPHTALSRRDLLRVATPAATTGTDPLLHLLRRATYGPTPESEAEVRELGASAWLARQLDPGKIPDARCAAVLARFPHLGLDINGVHAAVRAGKVKAFSWDVMTQLG